MNTIASLTIAELKQALNLKERIEALNHELDSLAAGNADQDGGGTGRRMSAAARARIAAAARKRWAAHRTKHGMPVVAKKKRRVSPEIRAKLAAIARARWKKAKTAGKNAL